MAIPTHSPYIGREAKATAWLIHLVMWRTKSASWRNYPNSLAGSTDRECGCAVSRPHEDSCGLNPSVF